MAKNYYISDCYFGHENVIQFDKRPFASTDEIRDYLQDKLEPEQ